MSDKALFTQVGLNIAKARKEQNITKTKLGALANMNKSSISRAENGESNLSLKTLYRLSVALGVTVKGLLS